MKPHPWLSLAVLAFATACSDSDADAACALTNSVDDEEVVVSATQALTSREERVLLRAIAGLAGAPRIEAGDRVWSEAPGSAERALVRDFVETAWIDRDADVAARLAGNSPLLDANLQAGRSALGHSPEAHDGAPDMHGLAYTAVSRVIAGGDLVLAVSDAERAGTRYQALDLFRVAGGRVVEGWRRTRPSRGVRRSERIRSSGAAGAPFMAACALGGATCVVRCVRAAADRAR